MKTENWIDIRDRKPEGLCIFLWDLKHPQSFGVGLESSVSSGIGLPTHTNFNPGIIAWMPMPEFTVKEPTQEELDHAAFNDNRKITVNWNMFTAWTQGIAYERSAIRHLIERHCNGELPAPELIREISNRVKLT